MGDEHPSFSLGPKQSSSSLSSMTGRSRAAPAFEALRNESTHTMSADNLGPRRSRTSPRIADLQMSGSRATLSGREVILRSEGTFSSTNSLNWSGHQTHHRIVHSASCASDLDLPNTDLSPEELQNLNDQRINANQRPLIISPTGRVTSPLAITAFFAVFGGSFPHGWNTGVLNAPQEYIKDFLNTSYSDHYGSTVNDGLLNILWSLTVSVYLVGGCAGAFSAGWFANRFGRKRALLVLHMFGFIGGALFALCKYANSLEMLVLARLLVGFGCGAGSGLVPMYLTEIAPVNIRGAMGVLHQLGLTLGIFVSQIIGLRQLLGNETMWPYLLLLTALPCLICLLVLPFFPESPRYLLINRNDVRAAEAALQRFRGTSEVSLDLEEMELENRQQRDEPEWTFRQLLTARDLRLPLMLVCALACCQQLSGINVVFYYSSGVFSGAGITPEYIQYAVLGTGLINVVMTVISVPLVERSGRRPLLLVGMVIMVISMALLTVALNLSHKEGMPYVSIICVFTYVIGFAIGLGSIPQFIGGELFRQGPKPPAMSIGGLLNWLCNFIVGISFPSMEAAIKAYSFIPFIAIVVISIFYIWKYLPETRNRTYEEIYRLFAGQSDAPVHQDLAPVIYRGSARESSRQLLHQQQDTSFTPNGHTSTGVTEALLPTSNNGNIA